MRLKTTKAVGCGNPSDVRNVPLVPFQSSAESRSGNREEQVFGLVPVVDAQNHPLGFVGYILKIKIPLFFYFPIDI